MQIPMSSVDEILSFWFGAPGQPGYGKSRKVWFLKSPQFDQEIRDRFLSTYEQAAIGQLDDWQTSSSGALALILLLDQFPRNLFRNQPQAFATDTKAIAVAQAAIARGFDQQHPPVQRQFFYLPLEHSENLEHQQRCVDLARALSHHPEVATALTYALRHQQIIERFGRFPHRNQILGRLSTAEETAFLQQPGSSF
jgi:uncharacterized protein (DUF924 family)